MTQSPEPLAMFDTELKVSCGAAAILFSYATTLSYHHLTPFLFAEQTLHQQKRRARGQAPLGAYKVSSVVVRRVPFFSSSLLADSRLCAESRVIRKDDFAAGDRTS